MSFLGRLPTSFAMRLGSYDIESRANVFARGVPTVVEAWPYGSKRAGCSLERFVDLVSCHWTHYHQLDDPAFEAHPVAELPTLLASLGDAGPFTDSAVGKTLMLGRQPLRAHA